MQGRCARRPGVQATKLDIDSSQITGNPEVVSKTDSSTRARSPLEGVTRELLLESRLAGQRGAVELRISQKPTYGPSNSDFWRAEGRMCMGRRFQIQESRRV